MSTNSKRGSLKKNVAEGWRFASLRERRCSGSESSIGLYTEASEGSNQCRGGNAAVAGHIFFAQPLFEHIDIELAFRDDPLGNGARQDRSKGFNDPLVVEAITPSAHRVFGTAIGAIESRFHQQVP